MGRHRQSMYQDDQALLLDMLIAARQARKYVEGVTVQRYQTDELLQDGLVYQVQVIGEAASRVSQAFREAHPEIPWVDIVGMRNRVVHDCRRINRDIVWQVVQEDLPNLIAVVAPLVPPEPEES